jgi:transcriptional regulator with XRE-family HTH domain
MPVLTAKLRSKEKTLIVVSQRAIRTLDTAFNENTLEGMLRLLTAASSSHVVRRKGRRIIQTHKRLGDISAWSIGQKVRASRERKGWRQEDLALESGIARPNIARLEIGRHSAHLSTLRRVAKALDVQIDWLLKAPAALPSKESRESAEAGLVDWTAQLDREDRA